MFIIIAMLTFTATIFGSLPVCVFLPEGLVTLAPFNVSIVILSSLLSSDLLTTTDIALPLTFIAFSPGASDLDRTEVDFSITCKLSLANFIYCEIDVCYCRRARVQIENTSGDCILPVILL